MSFSHGTRQAREEETWNIRDLTTLQVTQEPVVLKNRYQMGNILEPGGPLQGILEPMVVIPGLPE